MAIETRTVVLQRTKVYDTDASVIFCLHQCNGCTSCSSDDLACYILDNNGFIVVSEDVNETGKFFGQVDGYTMNMLTEKQVFRKIHIFDYQAVCFRGDESKSDASCVTKVS